MKKARIIFIVLVLVFVVAPLYLLFGDATRWLHWPWVLVMIPKRVTITLLPAITAWVYRHPNWRMIGILNVAAVVVPYFVGIALGHSGLAAGALDPAWLAAAKDAVKAGSASALPPPPATWRLTGVLMVVTLLLGLRIGAWVSMFFWSCQI